MVKTEPARCEPDSTIAEHISVRAVPTPDRSANAQRTRSHLRAHRPDQSGQSSCRTIAMLDRDARPGGSRTAQTFSLSPGIPEKQTDSAVAGEPSARPSTLNSQSQDPPSLTPHPDAKRRFKRQSWTVCSWTAKSALTRRALERRTHCLLSLAPPPACFRSTGGLPSLDVHKRCA